MDYKYKRSADIWLDALFPRKCVCCDEIIDGEEELCDNCLRNIERVNPLKRCTECGLIKPDCDCKQYAYHFKGIVAPFYNTGIAQKGLYDFKLNGKEHYGIFFAREMAMSVKNEFSGIHFDAVCYVPASKSSYFKGKFNHSTVLAKRISDILKVPLVKNALLTRICFGSQHKSNQNRRFKRARNIFRYNKSQVKQVRNKTVLLVDDIKTTGATLDECSRQLLFAGAKEVYCVTALISERQHKPSKERTVITREKAEKILSRFQNNS